MSFSFFKSNTKAPPKSPDAQTDAGSPPDAATIPADQGVSISLESILGAIPQEFLSLSAFANTTATVVFPQQTILSQLPKGRVCLPLTDLLALLPKEMLATPLPSATERLVDLPLDKIIPQLPVDFFAPRPNQQEMRIDPTFFPSPFGVDTVEPDIPIAPPPPKPASEALPRPTPPPPPPAPAPPKIETTPPRAETPAPAVSPPKKNLVPPMASPPVPVAAADDDAPLSAPETRKFLININFCTAEDLTQIPGVGSSLAQRIIAFRNERGRINDVNELRQVAGVGNKTFRRIIGASPSRGNIQRLVNYLLNAPQDRELTLQEIVRMTAQLPGVQGCIMAMEDGVFVTGQLPPPLDAQTVSVFGSQLFRRVSRYVKELNVGQVRRFSMFTEQYPVSIFHAGRIYLVIVHDPKHFSKSLLRRCERIAEEINRMCTEHITV